MHHPDSNLNFIQEGDRVLSGLIANLSHCRGISLRGRWGEKMKRQSIYAMSFLLAGAAISQAHAAPAGNYAQTLIDHAAAGHKDILSLTMWARPDDKTPLKIMASHGGGGASTADPGAVSKTVTKQEGGHTIVELPLLDASRRPLGILSVEYAKSGGEADQAKRAAGIRDALARHISHFKNLSDQAQIDPAVPMDSYAQHLVDMEMAKHPEIVIMAIHASTPRNKDPGIIASNIGRIGKKADEDDMRVIEKGTENREVDETGIRFEAEIPL